MKTRILTWTLLLFTGIIHAGDFSGGTGTANNPYLISTAEDLDALRNYTGEAYTNIHFRLMNDIDLESFLQDKEEGWEPISQFYGNLHGNGHKIINLRIFRQDDNDVGFFGILNGKISNLGISIALNDSIFGKDRVGGLAGKTEDATISSCYVDGLVNGNSFVGGFIGSAAGENLLVSDCYSAGEVKSKTPLNGGSYVGGFIGGNSGTIRNSFSTAYVNVRANTTGGFIGSNTGNITACYSTGNVNSEGVSAGNSGTVGGFIGNNRGELNTCFSSGNVLGFLMTGGFIGGTNEESIINNCYARGNVHTTANTLANRVSAFADGSGGIISTSYATGNLTAVRPDYTQYLGLVGRLSDETLISKCYFDKETTEVENGVYVYIDFNNKYYAISGNTTAEMMQKSTFVDWDFENVWDIKNGETYPFFKWQTNQKALLKTATLSDGVFTPAFSSSIFDYTVYVGDDVEKISVIGNPLFETAEVGNIINADLSGNDILELKVTSEDKTVTNTYKINVVHHTNGFNPAFDATQSINVYPNPATDYINIDLQNVQETVKAAIYDLAGSTLSQYSLAGGKIHTIPLDELKGIYLLQINTNDGINNTKVVLR